MDLERALLSKIISTGRIEDVVTKGVEADHFADEECRDVYVYITSYARKYKEAPTKEAIEEEKPGFEFLHVESPLEFIIDRLRVQIRKRAAQDFVVDLAEAVDDKDKSETIELQFLEAARELAQIVPSDELAKFSSMHTRIEKYREEKNLGRSPGIPWGSPTLDAWTGGIKGHQLITVAAFSGIGKSTFLRALAFNVYLEGFTPYYVSLEEGRDEILANMDIMATNLDAQKFRQLKLTDDDEKSWEQLADEAQNDAERRDILINDAIAVCTPDKVFMETVKHTPDIIFIDYLSLMRSSSPTRSNSIWQSIGEITQELKKNARMLGIPIVAAAQTNRSGAKDGAELDNIGQAIAIVQDSDVVIGLHADEDMKREKRMEVRVNKNRGGRLGKIPYIWDHDRMVFREETMRDKFGKGGVSTSPAKKSAAVDFKEFLMKNSPKAAAA